MWRGLFLCSSVWYAFGMETFKSKRKIEEEITNYKRKRFEDYMVMADNGALPRALAIAALRDEISYSDELTLPDPSASEQLC